MVDLVETAANSEISPVGDQKNISQDIHNVLKKYWGYTSFRPLQEDIITSVLLKHDVLALLPTGGGKSLCFQVPGIVLGGTALVVSPLIALMNDQVENLNRRGISAVAITAQMKPKQIDVALNNAALGHVKFLYVSPERLQNKHFVEALAYLPVTLIAVDEAHCISQWGYDFRPSYLQIAGLRKVFPKVQVIALTASATPAVVSDIQSRLEFNNSRVFRQSFARSNLRYVVQHEDNKLQRLLKLIQNVGGSGVIYLRNRKKTVEMSRWLLQQGISSMAYHAGMKFDERQQIQAGWIRNKTQVICATNAFGMGIDKPDVRFVVHLDLPDSLEAYYQEAGRAGRDGKNSFCVLFYSDADKQRLLDNFERSFPAEDFIRQTYQALCNYFQVAIGSGEGISFEFDITRFCASYNLPAVQVYNAIRFMEKEGLLSLLDSSYEPSRLMILAGKEDLYELQVRSPKYEVLIKTLLRSYGGLFEDYVVINENEIARRMKTGSVHITTMLLQLDKEGVIAYAPKSDLPKLLFLTGRVSQQHFKISPANYNDLKNREKERVESVLLYATNNKVCRQVQLLRYFGELDYTDCGRCDVCLSRKPRDNRSVKMRIRDLLREKPLSFNELRQQMALENDKTWTKVFNELIDEGQVEEASGGYRLRP